MHRPALALIFAALLVTPAVAQPGGLPPTLAIPPALGVDGFGAVRIGMPHAQVEALAPGRLKAGGSDDTAVCEVYQFGTGGAVILEEEGRVARVSLYEPGLSTMEGVAVGDTDANVRAVYGEAMKRQPAPYADPPAHDLYVWRSPDAGLRFEIDEKGVIRAIHGGNQTIEYMEGCL